MYCNHLVFYVDVLPFGSNALVVEGYCNSETTQSSDHCHQLRPATGDQNNRDRATWRVERRPDLLTLGPSRGTPPILQCSRPPGLGRGGAEARGGDLPHRAAAVQYCYFGPAWLVVHHEYDTLCSVR